MTTAEWSAVYQRFETCHRPEISSLGSAEVLVARVPQPVRHHEGRRDAVRPYHAVPRRLLGVVTLDSNHH